MGVEIDGPNAGEDHVVACRHVHDLLDGRSAHNWRSLRHRRHHDVAIPRRRGRCHVLVRGHHHHVSTARASPDWWLQYRLGGSRLHGCPSIFNSGGSHWQRRHTRLFHLDH
jgi:hypothetical protein